MMKTIVSFTVALPLFAGVALAQGPAPAASAPAAKPAAKSATKGNRQVSPSENPASKAFAAKAVTLRPPAGQKVAIIVFEDLECPDCGRAHPLLMEAKRTYNIPVVAYDFPLAMHPWSFDAAVYARYFRGKSLKLDTGFRDYIFSNQPGITPENLRQYAETFAKANKIDLPFVIDPNDKLSALVKADFALGQRLGVQHTPTIWVVNNSTSKNEEPFVEVVDRGQLYALIDQMKAKAK